MNRIPYEAAVEAMTRGLERFLSQEDAGRLAEIVAGNSLDGVHSHGMNRYPRMLSDMACGLCDPRVTHAEKVGGFGALEAWDAHFGVGPLIAEDTARRAIALAGAHGVGCVAVRNNSHWLRAGRYSLMMAEAGFVGLCFTNTCLNLTAWGAKQPSTGNNPITLALPRKAGPLVMDMAVSPYAYGKLEIMAQEGRMLDESCGYDVDGNETCDPGKICESGLMLPIAKWKGTALSIMLDLAAAMLSDGRTSREIGTPAEGESGLSQVFIALHPSAVVDMEDAERRMEESIAFLHGLRRTPGQPGVHAPGEYLEKTREENRTLGLPVTEETWAKIMEAAKAADEG